MAQNYVYIGISKALSLVAIHAFELSDLLRHAITLIQLSQCSTTILSVHYNDI